MALVLYHLDHCANCEKARLALAIDGVTYESVVIDSSDLSAVKKASGQEEVPVLVLDDGTVLQEANRILKYLSRREGSKLLPDSRRDQALTWVLVAHADRIVSPLVTRLVTRRDPEGRSLSNDDLRVIERRFGGEITVIEGLLERGEFLFGSRPTLADVAMHAYLNRLPRLADIRLPAEALRVAAWYERMEKAADGPS
jgi:glutathione S-transferase